MSGLFSKLHAALKVEGNHSQEVIVSGQHMPDLEVYSQLMQTILHLHHQRLSNGKVMLDCSPQARLDKHNIIHYTLSSDEHKYHISIDTDALTARIYSQKPIAKNSLKEMLAAMHNNFLIGTQELRSGYSIKAGTAGAQKKLVELIKYLLDAHNIRGADQVRAIPNTPENAIFIPKDIFIRLCEAEGFSALRPPDKGSDGVRRV